MMMWRVKARRARERERARARERERERKREREREKERKKEREKERERESARACACALSARVCGGFVLVFSRSERCPRPHYFFSFVAIPFHANDGLPLGGCRVVSR